MTQTRTNSAPFDNATDVSSLCRSDNAALGWTYFDRLDRSRAEKAANGITEGYAYCQASLRRVVNELARRGLSIPTTDTR